MCVSELNVGEPGGKISAKAVCPSFEMKARLPVVQYDETRECGLTAAAWSTAFCEAGVLRHVALRLEDGDERRLHAGAEAVECSLVRLVRGVARDREALEPALRHLRGGERAEEGEGDPDADHHAATANDDVRKAFEHGLDASQSEW